MVIATATPCLKLGVLISGRGSNLQALIEACASPDFPATIALVLSNNSAAGGLQRAEAAAIPTTTLHHRDYASREAFEQAVDSALTAAAVDLVCLAGFMRILTPWLVTRWQGKMINIHPSLLPDFPGVNTHARAIAAGVPNAGCTVHYVVPEVDAGPIILQQAVPVLKDDTVESLASRVLIAEHEIYPQAIKLIAEQKQR